MKHSFSSSKIFSGFFYILFLIVVCQCCTNNNDKKLKQEQTFLKVGRTNVSSEILYTLIGQDTSSANKLAILDKLIEYALYYEVVDLVDDSIAIQERQKVMAYVQQNNCIRQIKDSILSRIPLDNSDVNKMLKYSNYGYMVDYIWIPRKCKKNIFGEVKEFCETLNDFYNISPELKKQLEDQGGVFELNKSVYAGTFIGELEKEVFRLNPNQILYKETNSGYHIIKYIVRLPNISLPTTIQQMERSRRIALKIEAGDTFFNEKILHSRININHQILSKLDFIVSPLEQALTNKNEKSIYSSKIVASYKGKLITVKQLIDLLNQSPQNIKSLYQNKSTRLKCVSFILLNHFEDENKSIQNQNEYNVAKYFSKELMCPQIKHTTNEDTMAILINCFNNLQLKDFRCLGIYHSNKNNCNQLHSIRKYNGTIHFSTKINAAYIEDKKIEDGLIKINPELVYEIEHLKLNYYLIDTLILRENLDNHNPIIAQKNSWELTKNEFIDYVKLLPPSTRIEIAKNDNSKHYIEYLAMKNTLGSQSNLRINELVLKEIDVIGNSLDQIYTSFCENDVVASFGHIKLTVGELRNVVSDLPFDIKTKFIDPDLREDALIDLVERYFWLSRDSNICMLIPNAKFYEINNLIMMNNFLHLNYCPFYELDNQKLSYCLKLTARISLNYKLNALNKICGTPVYLSSSVLNELKIDMNKLQHHSKVTLY
jgi:hypothetical protein